MSRSRTSSNARNSKDSCQMLSKLPLMRTRNVLVVKISVRRPRLRLLGVALKACSPLLHARLRQIQMQCKLTVRRRRKRKRQLRRHRHIRQAPGCPSCLPQLSPLRSNRHQPHSLRHSRHDLKFPAWGSSWTAMPTVAPQVFCNSRSQRHKLPTNPLSRICSSGRRMWRLLKERNRHGGKPLSSKKTDDNTTCRVPLHPNAVALEMLKRAMSCTVNRNLREQFQTSGHTNRTKDSSHDRISL